MKTNQWNRFFLLVPVLLAVGILSSDSVFAQTNIAIIDSDKLITEMPTYQEAQRQLEQFRDRKQDTLNQMNENLEERVATYQSQQGMMNDEARSEEENKLRQIQQSMVEFQRTSEQEMVDLQQSLLQPIRDKVIKAVDDIAAELGYDVVLDKASSAVVSHSSSIDITEKVAARLN